MLLATLRLLVDKGVVTEAELWKLADSRLQQLVTEEEARTQWHTPRLTTEALASKVPISKDTILLDAGSGFGGPPRELAERFGCRVIGVDRDPLRVLYSIRQTEHMGLSRLVSFCWGLLERLPFPDECFDIVWAQGSVTGRETKRDAATPRGMDRKIFDEFRRVLRRQGKLVCDVWIRGPVTDEDLRRFLGLAGFVLEQMEDWTEAFLSSQREAIAECKLDADGRASWQRSYEESLSRHDREYEFVAAKPARRHLRPLANGRPKGAKEDRARKRRRL
jgi:SAM-dependent methyltransferase